MTTDSEEERDEVSRSVIDESVIDRLMDQVDASHDEVSAAKARTSQWRNTRLIAADPESTDRRWTATRIRLALFEPDAIPQNSSCDVGDGRLRTLSWPTRRQ